MKRLLAILLAVTTLLSFAACGDKEADGNSSTDTTTDETADGVTTEDGSEEGSTTSDDADDNSADASSEEDVVYTESFDENGKYIPLNYEDMKIMKLTQWDLCEGILTNSSGTPHTESLFRKKAAQTMQNIVDGGFNTVLLQIRPFGDSFYKSQLYPLSYFVTGSYAKQEVKYDAVAIFIEEAHKRGLSIHGWINPMRLMTNTEIQKVTGDWAITDWYSHMGDGGEHSEYMFAGTDAGGTYRLYLNPAYEEVRNLIINGVGEILDLYNVDGIFMDDYFYPEEVKNKTDIDAVAYENRTDGSSTVFEFRCNSVNTLVRGIYSKVKEYGEDIIYGISPNGHISHAYSAECADIYTWCSNEGYCDIIYPQYYYGMIHGQVSISALMKQWDDVITVPDLKLVPILTLHKAGANDQWAINEDARAEWITYSDVLLMSMTYLLVNPYRDIDGIGFFCYQYFYGTESKNADVREEIANYAPIWDEYETLIGKSKEELVKYYASVGLDLKALGDMWDERLINTLRFTPMFEIPAVDVEISKGE